MLIADLYTFYVKSHIDQKIEATISVNPGSAVYSGHFPGYAVTPGVCQVLMIKAVLEDALSTPLLLTTANSIKVTSVHEPEKDHEICGRIRYAKRGDSYDVEGSLYHGEVTYLKFRGEFRRQG